MVFGSGLKDFHPCNGLLGGMRSQYEPVSPLSAAKVRQAEY